MKKPMPAKNPVKKEADGKLKYTIYTDKYPELERMIARAMRGGICFSRFACSHLETAFKNAGYGDGGAKANGK